MDAKLMKSALESELMPSVRKYFSEDPPAPWHLLNDNDKCWNSGDENTQCVIDERG